MSENKSELKVVECEISNDGQNSKEPLSCNHMICRECIDINSKICPVCGKVNENHDSIEADVVGANECFITKKLDQLLKETSDKLNHAINDLKQIKMDTYDKIDDTVDYLKDCVEVRIESLKVELDDLRDKYMDDLELIRDTKRKELDAIDQIETFEKEFQRLKDVEENSKSLFYEYRFYLNQTQKHLSQIQELYRRQLGFEASDIKLSEMMVGSVRDVTITNRIKEALFSKKFEAKKFMCSPRHCCVLANSNILISCDTRFDNEYKEYLMLFDSDLNLIKSLEKIGDESIGATGISLNENNIFIADNTNDRLVKTDFELNFIKDVPIDRPLAVMYGNKDVFVTQESKISRFTPELGRLSDYHLNFHARNIKIIENTVLLRPLNDNCMYFYEIKDDSFSLKHKIMGHNGGIGKIDSTFYEYDDSTTTMYIYNKFGDLIEEIKTVNYGTISGSIMFVDNKLIFPLRTREFIIINT